MKNIFGKMLISRELNRKMLAVLIDPAVCKGILLSQTISAIKTSAPDFVFIGGSHHMSSVDSLVDLLHEETDVKVLLFPGNYSQFSDRADALLFLSLLSGRNADFLIGQHVISSVAVKQSGIEVIPTAYILIDGGKISSVEYISNTKPIPQDKKEIVLSTAIAGELLGMHVVYLEAGSGAKYTVSPEIVRYLSENLSVPMIVGGGIRDTDRLKEIYDAGADLVVIGNFFESDPHKISEFSDFTQQYNEK
ncbi:MAG: geranylgeranylglyceryl/heptaprenylglyceryl phosphate synthase [Prevotellaceae bacterium]|jgi:putative glycerol-1-phosphate prenyltransferase|nr:geranylgeranylglyceryl/heptaprenylglyceryl phosphate synthase [Prevotellaceae bacterium]